MGTYRCYGRLVERKHLDTVNTTRTSRSVDRRMKMYTTFCTITSFLRSSASFCTWDITLLLVLLYVKTCDYLTVIAPLDNPPIRFETY